MTQKELEETTGIPQRTISDYETGRAEPRISEFLALVDAVNGTVGDALGGLPDHDAQTAELLLLWRGLSAEERRALLVILKAMTRRG